MLPFKQTRPEIGSREIPGIPQRKGKLLSSRLQARRLVTLIDHQRSKSEPEPEPEPEPETSPGVA